MEKLKNLYKESFISLQDIVLFDNTIFHSDISSVYDLAGTSQANKTLINSAIENGVSDYKEIIKELEEGLNHPSAVGFAAIDYILFCGEVTLNESSINYLCTICKIINHYAILAEKYYIDNKEKFISDNDFSARGSLSVLINTLMKQYEMYVRTVKVGIPIGIYGAAIVQKKPAPKTVEGYYHRKSLSTQLLHRSISSLKNFYYGIPYGSSIRMESESFGNFLREELAESDKGEELLALFEKTINNLENTVSNLDGDISELVSSANGLRRMTDIYNELQKIVGLMKAKIVVQLKLTITYTDGEEGD